MIHSEKARRNYEEQRARAKRQRDYQLGRSTQTDWVEFDPAADPRFVAHLRNKAAAEAARNKKVQDLDSTNTIKPFTRTEQTAV